MDNLTHDMRSSEFGKERNLIQAQMTKNERVSSLYTRSRRASREKSKNTLGPNLANERTECLQLRAERDRPSVGDPARVHLLVRGPVGADLPAAQLGVVVEELVACLK